MTTRLGQPNTPADERLQDLLTGPKRQNFVMVAGAGSGKTTSLIKALGVLLHARGSDLRRRGQKVACITYTEIAANEIWADVGNNPLFHISTIHSFLWTATAPFTRDIRMWVENRLQNRIEELRTEQAGLSARVGQKRRNRIAADIARYQEQIPYISSVPSFRYGTSSDYLRGVLGHADVLRMGGDFIRTNETFRRLLAQRFPFVFVDESQDTDPAIVEAFKLVCRTAGDKFCLGFFGDPMQKIYPTGIGAIAPDEGWETIKKPENFRCPTKVLDTINSIRAAGPNDLQQTRGRRRKTSAGEIPVVGSSRIFIVPADGLRTERIAEIRKWMATATNDPQWQDDQQEADVRLLVIVHRMAAKQLGFGQLYAALNDGVPDNISQSFADGTLWAVRPFIDLLPILDAATAGQDFRVISAIRAASPLLEPTRVKANVLADILDKLRQDLSALTGQLATSSATTVGDVLRFVVANETISIDERLLRYLDEEAAGVQVDAEEDTDNAKERRALYAYFAVPASELRGYIKYIQARSPFATQQGIKGAQFSRVLVIADDEEGRHFQFSYNKYFGVTPPSADDLAKQAVGEETQVERTRRLFYVCCSRAEKDLAVVYFTTDPTFAAERIQKAAYFESEDIIVAQNGLLPPAPIAAVGFA